MMKFKLQLDIGPSYLDPRFRNKLETVRVVVSIACGFFKVCLIKLDFIFWWFIVLQFLRKIVGVCLGM